MDMRGTVNNDADIFDDIDNFMDDRSNESLDSSRFENNLVALKCCKCLKSGLFKIQNSFFIKKITVRVRKLDLSGFQTPLNP